jgi:hypothetical protein
MMDEPVETRRVRAARWARANLAGLVCTLMLCGGIGVLGWVVHRHYPVQHWLFLRYAGYWLGTLTVASGAYGLGHVVLKRLRVRLPLHAHALVAFALGVFGFELLMFAVGVAQGYRTAAFFVIPPVLCAAVASPLYKHARRVKKALLRAHRRSARLGVESLAVAFGCLGLGMVYFYVLTPHNVQFDSRFKHMALAEQFVVQGGIRASIEGFIFTARPHFTSFLYTWAFLVPGRLFDKMELSAHLEFFIFVVTSVAGIPALVRMLIPRADPRWIWAVRFAFPGVMLYDSSVSGGADHVGAFFGVAIAICLLRVLRDLDYRHSALLGIFLAAAALTKETTAIMLVPAPCLLVAARGLFEAVRVLRGRGPADRDRRWLWAPLLVGAAALVSSAPLWATNFVLHGDPIYPILSARLRSHPFTDQAAYRFTYGYLGNSMWAPPRDLKGLGRTLLALVDHSFRPNDWSNLHRDVPVFGSLFTLLLPCLLLLGKRKRIWAVVAWVHVAIFVWYWVHHQDRYLQSVMPLMAAVTASIAILVWRSFGAAPRAALCGLFGLQIVWGGDVYFLQTHNLIKSPLKAAIDLLSAGHNGDYKKRFSVQENWQKIGDAMPRDGRLLLHLVPGSHVHLGTNRETILDVYLWQFGIEYGAARDRDGVWTTLHDMGVTHVFASPYKHSSGLDSIASDILFWDFVVHGTVEQEMIGGGQLARMPPRPGGAAWGDLVAVLSCSSELPASGLYRVSALRALPYGPDSKKVGAPLRRAGDKSEATGLVRFASFAVLDKACYASEKIPDFARDFEHLVERVGYGKYPPMNIYSRRPGTRPEPSSF